VLEPGRILGGKYRLEAEIGQGGMGSVWRSTRLDLGAKVAIKVMHGQTAQNPIGLERFAREAKAAASLGSPHVVRIIDFGLDTETHTPFIAMELLEGESLAQRLDTGVRLTPSAASRVITQVARALSEAHAAGIIHRDLKPANIFLVRNDDDELVKLLDFGVAKATGGVATATGNVMGTPYYMSPEQIHSAKGIDHRSDLWSLGVIASECLTGRKPFTAETLPELAMKIALGRAELPSSVAAVPAGFDAWFARAISVDPAARFQTAAELALALQTLTKGDQVGVASGSASLALASTQELASTGGAPSEPAASPLVAGGAAEQARGAALSTTALGSALSASLPHRARSWSLPFGTAAVVVTIIGVGAFVKSGQERTAPVVESRAALGAGVPAAAPSGGAQPSSAGPPASSVAPPSTGGEAPAASPPSPSPPAASPVAPAAVPAPQSLGSAPSAPTSAARSRSARTAPARAANPAKAPKPPKPPQSPQSLDRLDAYDMP